jgi:hypothetical protein
MKKLTFLTLIIVCFSMMCYSQDTLTAKKESHKPKATYQIGSAKITVWENKRTGKQGDFIAKDFKVEKIYKKGNEWKSTNYFNERELLELKAAIDKAIDGEMVKVKEGDKVQKK